MNSNAIVTTSTALPAQAMGQNLFLAFVDYIDRSPKTARTYLTNLRQFMGWMKYAGVAQPTRQDVINFREWLTVEHDAIEFDPAAPQGWKYRTDHTGNPQRVTCKPNTVKQYLQSVKQFFSWAAAEGLYSNVAANIHAPKITDSHRKDSLTAQDVQTIEQSITNAAGTQQAAAASAKKDTAGRIQRSSEFGKIDPDTGEIIPTDGRNKGAKSKPAPSSSPETDKDKRIQELEDENRQLKLQISALKREIERITNSR